MTTDWYREWRSRFSLTGEVPSHGLAGYVIGCRCKTCRDENNTYQREWRANHKQKAQLPPPGPSHPAGAVCPACHRVVRVVSDGRLRIHSVRGDRCFGSGTEVPA